VTNGGADELERLQPAHPITASTMLAVTAGNMLRWRELGLINLVSFL
jgi:hypothetical protein